MAGFPPLCVKGCGRPRFDRFDTCCVRCDGTRDGHNRDCESKAAHTLALADPSVPCGAEALGGQWRAACTFACCIVQPKSESDSENEEPLAKRARQASGLALCCYPHAIWRIFRQFTGLVAVVPSTGLASLVVRDTIFGGNWAMG